MNECTFTENFIKTVVKTAQFIEQIQKYIIKNDKEIFIYLFIWWILLKGSINSQNYFGTDPSKKLTIL